MSKIDSGLFEGTVGESNRNLHELFSVDSQKSTAEVWEHIGNPGSKYSGTNLPKYFEIDTPQGKMWTHPNATKHMHETLISTKNNPKLKNSNPNLFTQFILYDYYKSLGGAVNKQIKYNRIVNKGNWEFKFAKPRNGGKYPVVIHAKFTGLK